MKATSHIGHAVIKIMGTPYTNGVPITISGLLFYLILFHPLLSKLLF